MSILRNCVLVGGLGLAIVAGRALADSMPSPEVKMENLLQKALTEEFIPGREVVVSYVEIPPNTTMDRHWHPGEEFQYYIEGKAELLVDGQPPFSASPGKVGHVPFKKMHTVVTKDQGLKVVVFRVHTKGQPIRYLEKGGSAEK
jgi:quercetin dioxygenase-like cupin family protein